MSRLHVRSGKVDVAIVCGPRTRPSSIGIKTLLNRLADSGLVTGFYDPSSGIQWKGIIPQRPNGAVVLLQDIQGRVHRVQARSVVKISALSELPEFFPGFFDSCTLSTASAMQFLENPQMSWGDRVVILGTGNRALQLGHRLLQRGVKFVSCLEIGKDSYGKRYLGWEVNRRKFEMSGGRIIEGQPLSLTQKTPILWEFRVQDAVGIRVMEIHRLISAAFPNVEALIGVREYPPGSLLFEMPQSSLSTIAEDVEGHWIETENALALSSRIVRALGTQKIARELKKTMSRASLAMTHLQEPFEFKYQGRILHHTSLEKIQSFPGTPKSKHSTAPVASIECFESIACRVCESACPEKAIQIDREGTADAPPRFLIEDKCVGCGDCVKACPSQAIVMLQENVKPGFSDIFLPPRKMTSTTVQALNRKGEPLGQGRVEERTDGLAVLRVPSHLIWDARNLAFPDQFIESLNYGHEPDSKRIEIQFNGRKRIVKEGVPFHQALFELGVNRPEEILNCRDQSCRMCRVDVDGVRQLACSVKTRKGMSVVTRKTPMETQGDIICPCLGIKKSDVMRRLQESKVKTPDAAFDLVQVGLGKCHGQICVSGFKNLLQEVGIDTSGWIDWRVPSTEWFFTSGVEDL